MAANAKSVEVFPRELVRLEKVELPLSKRRSVFKRALHDLSMKLSVATKSCLPEPTNVPSLSRGKSTEDVSEGPPVPEKDEPIMQFTPTTQEVSRLYSLYSHQTLEATVRKATNTPPASPWSRCVTERAPGARPLNPTTYSRRTTLPHVQSDCSPLIHGTPLQHARSAMTLRDDSKRSQHRRTNSNTAVKHNSGVSFRSLEQKLPRDLQRTYDMHEASIRYYGRTPLEEARRERARQSLRLQTGASHNRISAPSFSNLASSGMEVTVPMARPGTKSRTSDMIVEQRPMVPGNTNTSEQLPPLIPGARESLLLIQSTACEPENTAYDGIEINSFDPEGYTLLHKACIDRQTRAVELLLDAGSDVRIKDRAGRTPLHLAAITRQRAIVEILLDRIPARSIPELWNSTILHDAVSTGDEAIIQMLVQHGADVDAKDENGVSAVDYALSKGFIL